jgi:hypothetical protein
MSVLSAHRSRAIGRRVIGMVVAILSAAGLLVSPNAIAARARPDLIVDVGRLSIGEKRWTARGLPKAVVWRHKTKNVGAAPSRRSLTELRFETPGGYYMLDSDRVPYLESDGNFVDERRRYQDDFTNIDYGSYPATICADAKEDVNERREGNNCKDLGLYYVVPWELTGVVSGVVTIHPQPDITNSLEWRGDVDFDLRQGAPDGNVGLFEYRYLSGDMVFTYTTVAGECTGTGTGRYTPTEADGVKLNFGQPNGSYSAFTPIDPNFNFPVTITCPDVPPATAPFYPHLLTSGSWMITGFTPRRFPDPGLKRVRGTYTLAPPFPVQFSWNLKASDGLD